MKKLTFVLVLVLVLAFVLVSVAYAITNGEPDGDNHPYVGLIVFDDEDGPAWRCSGALISENVVLTAGHCTDGAVAARVWFEEDVQSIPLCDRDESDNWIPDPDGCYPLGSETSVEGTPHTNPKYDSDENPYGGGNGLPAFSYRDVGVVVLDEAMSGIGFAELPEAELVDTLKNKSDVDFVGYGVQYQAQIPGKYLPSPPPYYRWTGLRARMYAPSQMVSGNFVHSAEYMRLSLNPGGGTGGTCFGDSGGPGLLDGTDTVLAVNSYVTNINCSGVGYSARVDIPEVLTWINTFMTQP